MVDVALIELEGVLFDTDAQRYESLRDAIAAQGLDIALEPEVVSGLAPRAAVVAALARAGMPADNVLVDLLAVRAERAFTARLAAGGVGMRPGARAFIQLAAGKARLGSVTRAGRGDADTMLRLAGLDTMFTIVVCADDTLDVKPAADGYHLALERLKRQRPFARGAVLALEDGAPGIRAARTANIRCAADGPLPAHVAMEADAYVPSLEGQTLASLDQLSRPGQERVQ
jgi:beta-phosphoglucomutase-like phosphatase (HAD superfamily)